MTSDIEDVIARLNEGGVVLLPTDTVFGLAARPDFPAAVDRIFKIKGRPRRVNLPAMAASRDDIIRLGARINPPAERLLSSGHMPGPLTLVLELRGPAVPDWLCGRDEIAVRMPDDARLLRILEKTGPLLVTSANPHGRRPAASLDETVASLDTLPDLALRGNAPSDAPSTIVNCRTDPPTIEREGVIPAETIRSILGG